MTADCLKIHIVADVSKTDLRTECEEEWFKGEEDVSEKVERMWIYMEKTTSVCYTG
jgi:hypothetical protein